MKKVVFWIPFSGAPPVYMKKVPPQNPFFGEARGPGPQNCALRPTKAEKRDSESDKKIYRPIRGLERESDRRKVLFWTAQRK